jgi:hypothetical protein
MLSERHCSTPPPAVDRAGHPAAARGRGGAPARGRAVGVGRAVRRKAGQRRARARGVDRRHLGEAGLAAAHRFRPPSHRQPGLGRDARAHRRTRPLCARPRAAAFRGPGRDSPPRCHAGERRARDGRQEGHVAVQPRGGGEGGQRARAGAHPRRGREHPLHRQAGQVGPGGEGAWQRGRGRRAGGPCAGALPRRGRQRARAHSRVVHPARGPGAAGRRGPGRAHPGERRGRARHRRAQPRHEAHARRTCRG